MTHILYSLGIKHLEGTFVREKITPDVIGLLLLAEFQLLVKQVEVS